MKKLWFCLLGLGWVASVGAVSETLNHRSPDTAARLLRLPNQSEVRLDEVALADGRKVSVRMERFEVFAPGAQVRIHGEGGQVRSEAAPAMAHYRGEIDGQPGSRVLWSVRGDGSIRALLHLEGQVQISEGGVGGEKARLLQPEDAAGKPFQCGADDHSTRNDRAALAPTAGAPGAAALSLPTEVLTAAASNTVYTANVAVETDYEYFQLFGTTAKAVQYTADLFAYVSTVYANEILAQLKISDLYLYASAADPWSVTSDTGAALDELQNYWVANRSDVQRSLVHMLSGKNMGGGVAYIDALCDNSWGYGFSGGLEGNFSAANPKFVWDALVVAHEIGHTFGSPHTHSAQYENYGGNSNPVDCCASDGSGICNSRTATLPGIGSLSGGPSGAGAGTIMSYCHTLLPGMANTSMTFGTNQNYGIAAYRVPQRIRAALESVAATSASCLSAQTGYSLNVSLSGGGGSVSSTPAGISCGTSCTARFNAGSSVTLTAQTQSGAIFRGWQGDCGGTGTCTLTMDRSHQVAAVFEMPDDGFPALGGLPTGWSQSSESTVPWGAATDQAFAGSYSMKSGAIGNLAKSGLVYAATFQAGNVSFARKVSSETGFDYLRFYIDGVLKEEWSGNAGWAVVSYPLSVGSHELKWVYEKDPGVSAGSDAAWIDAVSLPTNVVLTGISLQASSLRETASTTLVATPSGASLGNCSSSDTSVATVSGSSVIALKAGTAQISCSGQSTTLTVLRQLDLAPSSLVFPNQVVGVAASNLSLSLSNGGSTAVTLSSISISGDFSYSSSCGASLAAGASCNIAVGFKPTATGTRNGTLTLNTSAAGNSYSLNLTGTGYAPAGSLGFSSTSLNFGAQEVGVASSVQGFTVSNSGNVPVSITDVAVVADSDFIIDQQACKQTLAVAGSCQIQLHLLASKYGAISGQVVLSSSAVGSPHTLSLSGQGGARLHFNLIPGWNLLGNGLDLNLAVSLFGDANLYQSVWTWDRDLAGWRFYSPQLDATALQNYASGKGYGVLSQIPAGEGFWVYAKSSATPSSPVAQPLTLGPAQLRSGWNLLGQGLNLSPSLFNSSLSETPPNPGVVPLNLQSLWAWEALQGKWLFYAPSLEAQGGTALLDYITGRNYLDFTQTCITLQKDRGFWIKK